MQLNGDITEMQNRLGSIKTGNISAFGKITAPAGKWYERSALYPINRIYYVHNGRAVCEDNGECVSFEPSKIYFIPESDDFAPVACEGEPFVHSYVDFSLISPITCARATFANLTDDPRLSLAVKTVLLACEERFCLHNRDEAYASAFLSMLSSSVSYILTHIAAENNLAFVTDEVVMRALYLMSPRGKGNVSVKEIAKEVYMSEDGFIRHFAKVMGITPYAYQKRMRLSVAEGMLNTGEDASYVASYVGYSDTSSLLHALNKRK